jgi:hypothetical protein
MNFIKTVPVFLFALVIFWILGYSGMLADFLFQKTTFSLMLPSGKYQPSYAYIVLMIGIILFCVEILKSSFVTNVNLVENALSVLTFIGYMLTFIFMPWACNSVFFIFTIFCLFDVIMAYGLSINVARRTISMS